MSLSGFVIYVTLITSPVSENADVDELFAVYDSVLRDIADRVAPPHNIRRRCGYLAP